MQNVKKIITIIVSMFLITTLLIGCRDNGEEVIDTMADVQEYIERDHEGNVIPFEHIPTTSDLIDAGIFDNEEKTFVNPKLGLNVEFAENFTLTSGELIRGEEHDIHFLVLGVNHINGDNVLLIAEFQDEVGKNIQEYIALSRETITETINGELSETDTITFNGINFYTYSFVMDLGQQLGNLYQQYFITQIGVTLVDEDGEEFDANILFSIITTSHEENNEDIMTTLETLTFH